MTQNQAAWALAPFDRLTVAEAPFTPPGPGQIVVRNRAVAINPVDRYKQQMGNLLFGWIKYPAVFGYDLAGEVVAVGAGVSRFKVGDRVVGTATGMDKPRNRAAEGAFQLNTVVLEQMAAPIPDAMRFEAACVLPLGLCTAATGLFEADQLGLNLPSAKRLAEGQTGRGAGVRDIETGATDAELKDGGTDRGVTEKGAADWSAANSPSIGASSLAGGRDVGGAERQKTVLIWGGSTSVGCNAIQLATAAGYRVVTTASPANFGLVMELGAAEVFDYRGATVVVDVVRALQGHEVAGALAMGEGSAAACMAVLGQSKGRRHVALATFPLDIDSLPTRPAFGTVLTKLMPMMLRGGAGLWLRSRRLGVTFSVIYGTRMADTELSRVIFDAFLPEALRSGAYVAAPAPLVVGHGLEAIQTAFDRHRQGVSARKVVVTL